MKLISIELNNFRQYYGENNHINFNDSDITVVLGENGCGKTGIFRAMIFALFGLREIDEDSENGKSESVHLVNMHKLKENQNNKTEASVVVEFENDDEKYVIKRKVFELLREGSSEVISDSNTEVAMQVYDKNGNMDPNIITDQETVLNKITDIINPKLKDFFFFNGEKIEELARTDKLSRETIKNGILKLLQIDNLEKALASIKKVQKEQQRKISEGSSIDLKNKYLEQRKVEEKLEALNNGIVNLEKEKILAQDQLDKIKQKMKQNDGIKQLLMRQDSIEKEIRDIDNNFIRIQEIFNKSLQNCLGNELISDYIDEVYDKLSEQSTQSNISPKLIEEIISNKKCICGKCFDEDSSIQKIFEEYLKNSKTTNSRFYSDWMKEINQSKGKVQIQIDGIESNISLINSLDMKREELEHDLEEIKEQRKDYSLNSKSELEELDNAYSKYEEKLRDFKANIIVSNNNIEREKINLSKIKEEIIELESLEEKNKNEIKKKQYYDRLLNMFESIKNSYTKQIREQLSVEMLRLYKNLIAEKDKELINKIIIDDEYKIDIKNWQGVSILQDISAGQKQILSLSLIIALSILACDEENKINVPLFMDTPFGRMSLENREKIITNIPNEMKQWILLVTDTEMTKDEINYLYETKKWNKAYKLEQTELGKTEIKPVENVLQLLM